jgi:hypothetical protein
MKPGKIVMEALEREFKGMSQMKKQLSDQKSEIDKNLMHLQLIKNVLVAFCNENDVKINEEWLE